MSGMTPIVRNVAGLVSGFVVMYGLYVATTGHLAPGGGFAAGAIIVAAAVMLVLARGGEAIGGSRAQPRCRVLAGFGALAFVSLAAGGFLKGGWFVNFLPKSGDGLLASGTILLSDASVCLMVAAGLIGIFLALVAGTTHHDVDRGCNWS